MSLNKAPLRAVLAAAIALGLAGCSSSHPPSPSASGSPATGTPSCLFTDIHTPGWVPRDLPLPRGTFASRTLDGAAGFHRVAFIVPGDVRAFHHFIRDKWPGAGYVLGKMEPAHKRFAGSFVNGSSRGTFLAQIACGGDRTILYLSYAPGSPSPSSS
jgi:hypothetical protein